MREVGRFAVVLAHKLLVLRVTASEAVGVDQDKAPSLNLSRVACWVSCPFPAPIMIDLGFSCGSQGERHLAAILA